MDNFIQKSGLFSSAIAILSIIIWFVSFGLIASQGELFFWTDAEAYYQYIEENNQIYANLAKTFMLIFSLAYMVLHFSFYENKKENKEQIFSGKLGLVFMSFFALLSAIHYFAQVSTVRLSLIHKQTEGLEQFIQANPLSFTLAINMLGWTLMMGLASFFFYFFFRSIEKHKWLAIFHGLNFIFSMAAMIGFVTKYDPLTFISINMGVGGCITVISIIGFLKFNK